MIVDFHRHMWSALERHPVQFRWLPEEEQSAPTDFDWRVTAHATIQEMDAAGVDVSVLIVADFALRFGEAAVGVMEENQLIWEAHQAYPDRLVPFFGIDPRRERAADQVDEVLARGTRGVKLHPAVGFFPHDPMCYAIYESCAARGVPVLFHCGPGFHPNLYSRFSHPLEYDQVAADFPQLPVVLAHAGADWWRDCIVVARAHPNVYLELSEWQLTLRDRPEEASEAIAEMYRAVGPERIIWGSDFPHVRRYMTLDESIAAFVRLAEAGSATGGFTTRDLDAILGGTARRLLRLA